MGFAKAFGYGNVTQLSKEITKTAGIFWSLTALLFCVTLLMFIFKKESWPIWAFISVAMSQIMILTVWEDAKFGTLANILIVSVAVTAFSTDRYYQKYLGDVKAAILQNDHLPASLLTETDIKHLPESVKKYIRYSGSIGKPKVYHFKIKFSGKIKQNEKSEWMPFTSEQNNFMELPTRLFFMNAIMKHLPVAGYHAYLNGKAYMDIRLFSLFRVQYMDGIDMDIAETVTFFNDMCCMAPATLIDSRISWQEISHNNVAATFTNNGISIHAKLIFNDAGQLINFISDDRYDANAGKKLPWSTPLRDYKEINGYNIAGGADAVYTYPEGDLIYGTFNRINVVYNQPD